MATLTELANTELAGIEAKMAPQMDKLRSQVDSTDLINSAQANSSAQAEGAQAAVTRATGAGGATGTTRQVAMAAHQAKLDSNKAQVGAINNATGNQSATNEAAQSKLSDLSTQLQQTAMTTRLDAAGQDQAMQMQKDSLAAQKKNGKKSFWGKVAGTALGIGASMLL